jgi:hypothetical protein
VFAINDKNSYDAVEEFLTSIKEISPENVIKVLVGNKKDLEKERRVLNETAYDFAKEN